VPVQDAEGRGFGGGGHGQNMTFVGWGIYSRSGCEALLGANRALKDWGGFGGSLGIALSGQSRTYFA
jgi:hypothetical protein